MAKGSVSRLAEVVHPLVQARYPASYWWWTGVEPPPVWPVWNAREFSRVGDRWRRIARLSEGQRGDGAIWGAHARTAVVAIGHHRAWRLAHVPLTMVRTSLESFWVYQRLTQQVIDWQPWLLNLERWFEALLEEELQAGDVWVRAHAERECDQIAAALTRANWLSSARHAQSVHRLLRAIRRRLAKDWTDSADPVSWARLSELDTDEWHRRRLGLDVSALAAVVPLSEALDQLAQILSDPEPTHITRLPELRRGGWILPGASGMQVALPAVDTEERFAIEARIWWIRHAETTTELGWALADPVYVEGVILALWTRLTEDERFAGYESLRRYLRRWLTLTEALAVADAWLWLEAGDPDEVFRWMLPWSSKGAAARQIGRMQIYPGYWLARECLRQRILQPLADADSPQEWPGWARGPVDG